MNNRSKLKVDNIFYNNITKETNKNFKLSKKIYEESLLLLDEYKNKNHTKKK